MGGTTTTRTGSSLGCSGIPLGGAVGTPTCMEQCRVRIVQHQGMVGVLGGDRTLVLCQMEVLDVRRVGQGWAAAEVGEAVVVRAAVAVVAVAVAMAVAVVVDVAVVNNWEVSGGKCSTGLTLKIA